MYDTSRGPMAGGVADPVPLLREGCVPPLVIGTASLVTAAMNGADSAALAAMIDRLDTDPVARLYDTSIAFQLAFRRDEALDLQRLAIGACPVLRIRREGEGERGAGAKRPIRLLALVAPGDLMVNTPLDFITSHLDVRLDLLFLTPGRPIPAILPEHDLIFFAASEPDAATLTRMRRLFRTWPRPALNNPGILPELARDSLTRLLSGVPGLCSPPTVEVGRIRLNSVLRAGGGIAALLPGCGYPVLIRPVGSHAGQGLEKIERPSDLAAYLRSATAGSFYITAFMDYAAPDGLYRKYRVAFIEGEPHLCHMAASQHWMVHYLNAGMAESAEKRADEAECMAHFSTGFAARHRQAFIALHQRLPFDYCSIDCAELPDGRLLVFEADTAAIIHAMDPVDTFAYKHTHMRGVFAAFGAMLQRRGAIPAPA